MENALQVTPRREIERARRDGAQPIESSRVIDVRPSIDAYESGEQLRIVADVPGVDASGADVQLEMPHLRIACTRAARNGRTIRYATTLTLPRTVDPSSLSAELRDGVLEITMTKNAESRARRIEVKTA